MTAIGVSRPRIDAPQTVTGGTRYAADLPVLGLLHARLVLASEAHALIRGLDRDSALAVPGVVAVLAAEDLPIVEPGDDRTHQPLARETVVFAGQPVALVVAESEAAAEDGAEAVVVELEPLEPVLDLEAAMAPEAPLARPRGDAGEGSDLESVHAAVGGAETELPEEELSGNVLGRAFYREGDVDEALAQSDVVVDARFSTSRVYQAYLEPQTATAWLEGDVLVVYASTQGTFLTRDTLASLFGLPLDRVRVRAAALGGAFGGKLLLAEPLAAAAALRLRRPVRVTFTRSEDFAAANPAPPELFELRIGARRTGELTGLDARVLTDRGALTEWGLEEISSILVAGCYRWPTYRIRGYGVMTNVVTMGAYRAPGAPPAFFALESLMNELAGRLELDPIELRLRNVVGGEERMPGGGPAPAGARQCLERIREHSLWRRRGELPAGEGVGVAVAYWPGGTNASAAACRLDADGGVTVITGAVDMSGTKTAFAVIAAEALGFSPEKVRVVEADTSVAPHAGVSGGSAVTFTSGLAVLRAAEQARERLLLTASEQLEIAPADLEVADGVVRAVGAPARSVTVEELARKALSSAGAGPIEGHGFASPPSPSPSAAAHLVHVGVDRETGEVSLLGYAVAQDVGRALNPAIVEGQIRGGATQGIGWALYEELAHDEHGQPLTGSFLDYAVPTAERVPEIETLIVEVPAPDGPFGAKGIGEAPVIAAPAAIANAIAAAVGARLRELPMTPARILAALDNG